MSNNDINKNGDVHSNVQTTPKVVGDNVIASPMSVEQMHEKLFSAESKKLKRITIEFFNGIKLDMSQCTLSHELAIIEDDYSDQESIIKILIEHAYMPGTNTKAFTIAHKESLMEMPMGIEFRRVIDAYKVLSGIDIEEAEKN